MATLKIVPSQLKGRLVLPPSKSHTLRAILFGSMGEGTTRIHSYLKSPDTEAMVRAMTLFGVAIQVQETCIEIAGVDGQLKACKNVIDAGNSGQVLRFVGSLAALLPSFTVITGDHSICYSRPVQPLLGALSQLKAFATSSRLDGMAPIIVQGPLQPGFAELDGQDSQPVSGLLIAASFLNGTTKLHVKNPGEKPWIDLTLSWLHGLGGDITHHNYEHYTIRGPLKYKGFEKTIPGDFSSAAFALVAALITKSTLTIENIDMEEIQGDKKIITILAEMGACFEINAQKKTLTVGISTALCGIKIDVNDCIDALPILAVLGCFVSGKTEITNASIARKKECDRIKAISQELRKMGASIEEKEDGLIITPAPLKGAQVFSHADHRIAMALSVAAFGSSGVTFIDGVECIAKSYPSFVSDFQNIGGAIESA